HVIFLAGVMRTVRDGFVGNNKTSHTKDICVFIAYLVLIGTLLISPLPKASAQTPLISSRGNVSYSNNTALHTKVITVNTNAPGVLCYPAFAWNHINRGASISEIARSEQATAAVNSSYFTMLPRQRYALGLVVRDGVIQSFAPYNRTTLIITKEGKPVIVSPGVRLQLSFKTGTMRGFFTNVNMPRGKHDVVFYTPFYGATTQTKRGGSEVILRRRAGVFYIEKTLCTGCNSVIPGDGAVLSFAGQLPGRIIEGNTISFVVDKLGVPFDTAAQAVQAGPRLVKNGNNVSLAAARRERIPVDIRAHAAMRTAVGITKNGKLIMVVSTGEITLSSLAQKMIRHGAVDAMNFDGGGSSGYFFNGNKRRNGRLVPTVFVVREGKTYLGISHAPAVLPAAAKVVAEVKTADLYMKYRVPAPKQGRIIRGGIPFVRNNVLFGAGVLLIGLFMYIWVRKKTGESRGSVSSVIRCGFDHAYTGPVLIENHRDIYPILEELCDPDISVINFDAHDDATIPEVYAWKVGCGSWVAFALLKRYAREVVWINPAWLIKKFLYIFKRFSIFEKSKTLICERTLRNVPHVTGRVVVSIDFDYFSSALGPRHRPSEREIEASIAELIGMLAQWDITIVQLVLCTSRVGNWVYWDQVEFIREKLSEALERLSQGGENHE
ncbi:MAG TPA: phosphodiester glycosidase family protein, partial [Candidatus Omnitrophota bacterium]|nr:phosphodiester glycosidase family protein [Candidatus Omnitrophota bacterium]